MTSHRRHAGAIGTMLIAVMLAGLLPGCTIIGPKAIGGGRLAYSEVINETSNQQMLMAVVHNRYEERSSLLAVTNVTANIRFTTTAGIQAGYGDSDNYSGNLVPFSAGAVYEENPTISYAPVEGEKYVQHLMSPVPLEILAQFAGAMTDPGPVISALVTSVNGIHNPDFLQPGQEPDPRFLRFVMLMTELTEGNALHWVEDPEKKGKISIVISHYAPTWTGAVAELYSVLGLTLPPDPEQVLILPVSLGLDGSTAGGIGIITKSPWDLIEILCASVEVPEEDLASGYAATFPPPGLVGRRLRVHSADKRPEHAYVAVERPSGTWFYIDERDRNTKQYFRLMSSLWAITISESAYKSIKAPVLTVPVSR